METIVPTYYNNRKTIRLSIKIFLVSENIFFKKTFIPGTTMKYKIYTQTKKFLDALQNDIYEAKTSIYIEMYIFLDNNKKPYNFVETLIEKSKQGVHVVLVLDAFGSRELDNKIIQKMIQAKIDVRFFSNRLRRTHRKLVMIDENIAFFG
jgi:phosphatidylserine/phosphatidylglycerophosphate/cardiolipin synthase-like enzyme